MRANTGHGAAETPNCAASATRQGWEVTAQDETPKVTRQPGTAGAIPGMALGLSVSLAIHAVAAAAMTFAVAQRAVPALPSEAAYDLLWQDETPSRAERLPVPPHVEPDPPPQGTAATDKALQGKAAEDARLPVPMSDSAPDTTAEAAPAPIARPGSGASTLAALLPHSPVLTPPAETAEPADLPLPPPLPPPPPAPRRDVPPARSARPEPVPAVRPESAAFAVPAPAPPAPDPATAPLVSGVPRFRRPPPPPNYPARARDRGEEGSVALRLLVDAEGGTREVRVQHSSGNRLLDEAAIAAARRWEVEPAVIGGRRTMAWVEVPVRFRLEE